MNIGTQLVAQLYGVAPLDVLVSVLSVVLITLFIVTNQE